MLERDAPVAVFDSGLGGLSVLRALLRELPSEDFHYFGDSANAPYGTKRAEEVRSLTFAAARDLFERGCKALVVACNTATSAAIDLLRKTWPGAPVVGIEPALGPAATHKRILVLATEMTLRGTKFQQLLSRVGGEREVFCQAAPGIVEAVERGETDGPALAGYLEALLAPYRGIEAVVLGCTHFPFAKTAIARALGGTVTFYDGAEGVAREARRRLAAAGLLSERSGEGRVELRNSRKDLEKISWKLFESAL